GNRGLYQKGWKAVTYHGTEGMIYDGVTDPARPFDEDVWELYQIAEDLSESQDLASERPDKLRELQELWWIEAARNNVLPLQATFSGRGRTRPRPGGRRHHYIYRPGGAPVDFFAAVNVKNRSHTITAEVEIPPGGAEGVLVTVPILFGIGEALRCGRDGGASVSDDYVGPFPFTGRLKKVIVEVEGGERRDLAQEAAIGLARQ